MLGKIHSTVRNLSWLIPPATYGVTSGDMDEVEAVAMLLVQPCGWGLGNSNYHGARPVHLIITMIQWIRTSRLPIKHSEVEAVSMLFDQPCG